MFLHAAAMCPELQPPANGLIVTTGTQFGSTATYSCLPGFNLVGNEQRTCQANGFWSGIEPFCQGKSLVPLHMFLKDILLPYVIS